MSESLTNTKRKRVKHPKQSKKLKYLVAIVLLGLFGISAYVIVESIFSGEADGSEQVKAPYGSLEELTKPENFKKAYLKANGGAEHLTSLQTLRIIGHIVSGDRKIDLFVLKRNPDMMLMTYDFGRSKTTYVSKDGEFWMRQSTQGQADVVTDVPEEELPKLRKLVPMLGPILLSYLYNDGQIDSIVAAEWQGQPCLRIEISNQGGSKEKLGLYVDPSVMQILASFELPYSKDAPVTVFKDYRMVSNAAIPHRIVTKNNGQETSAIITKSAQFNIGAGSGVFSRRAFGSELVQ